MVLRERRVVRDQALAEGLTEVQRLEHRVGVARVAEVLEAVVAFAVRDLSVELLLQSGGAVTLRTRAGEGTRWAGDRAVSTGTARLGHWNILSADGGAQGRGSAATRAGIWATDVPSCRAPSGTRLVSSAHRARPGVSLSARLTPPSDVASSRLVSSCGESFVASVCTPTLRVSSDGRPAAPAPLLDAQTRRGRIEEGPSSLPPRPWWRDISLTASPSSVAGARARLRPSARCRTTSCSAASSPPASSGPSGSRTPRTGPCATSSPSAHSQTPPSCPGTSVSDHCARPPRYTACAWWSSPSRRRRFTECSSSSTSPARARWASAGSEASNSPIARQRARVRMRPRAARTRVRNPPAAANARRPREDADVW